MPSISATPASSLALIPVEGFLRQVQILGRREVTAAEAARNKRVVEAARKKGKKVTRPVRPRPAILGIVPVSHTSWWEGIAAGRYPKPVRLGARAVAWKAQDIRALIEQLGKIPAPERGAPRKRQQALAQPVVEAA